MHSCALSQTGDIGRKNSSLFCEYRALVCSNPATFSPLKNDVINVKKSRTHSTLPQVGWREWADLPDLGIPLIKAKIDTGARTSAIDAKIIAEYQRDGEPRVRFLVQIRNRKKDRIQEKECDALVVDSRDVTNSGGKSEHRVVIKTRLRIGSILEMVEITLTRRKNMGFKMLVGRTAIRGTFVVNPGRSYLQGKPESQNI